MEHMQPVKQIRAPRQLRMEPQVLAAICETIGTREAETGGILGGCRETGEITHFFFDEAPRNKSDVLYSPNINMINEVKKTQWKPQGIDYLGSIHSHPPGFRRPSRGDEDYARRILEVLEVPYILVPIVTTLVDTGSFSLYPFAAVLEGGRVRIIDQELIVGGNPIRFAQERTPARKDDQPNYLSILIELNFAPRQLNGASTTRMPHLQRRYWEQYGEEFDDYD
jgi:proteasome lid subunit RPN8/RPN11